MQRRFQLLHEDDSPRIFRLGFLAHLVFWTLYWIFSAFGKVNYEMNRIGIGFILLSIPLAAYNLISLLGVGVLRRVLKGSGAGLTEPKVYRLWGAWAFVTSWAVSYNYLAYMSPTAVKLTNETSEFGVIFLIFIVPVQALVSSPIPLLFGVAFGDLVFRIVHRVQRPLPEQPSSEIESKTRTQIF